MWPSLAAYGIVTILSGIFLLPITGTFGMAMGAIPSKNIPKVVLKLAGYYVDNRISKDQSFQEYYSSQNRIAYY